jgi:hypothetical protein
MKPEFVSPPPGIHGRVLVAFLDDNDDPIWSEVLPLMNMQYRVDGAGTLPTMDMEFGMYSVRKSPPKPTKTTT